jgi:plastocyanin
VRGALILGAVLLAAASPAAAKPQTYVVTIKDMKFGALPAGLHVGDRIVWNNQDIFRHSATAQDKSFDLDLPAGKAATLVLRKAGDIAFVCKYHPGMKGTLKVAK